MPMLLGLPPMPPSPAPLPCQTQRGSIKAAARALAAPTEADEGLSVDPDVAEETLRRRKRCAAYVASAGGALPPASASAALPAQEAVLPSGAAATKADGDGSLRSTPKVAAAAGVSSGGAVEGDGEELAGAERPYAVEMFGLRKAYKASVVDRAGWLLGWICTHASLAGPASGI